MEGELVLSARYGELEEVQELLKAGVDVNEKDEQGRTALHMAAANGHLDVLEFLLQTNGIDVNAVNEAKNTALHFAALNGHSKAVLLLLQAGANPALENEFGRLPAIEAFMRGQHDVEAILEQARPPKEGGEDANEEGEEGETIEGEEGETIEGEEEEEEVTVRVGDMTVDAEGETEEVSAPVEDSQPKE